MTEWFTSSWTAIAGVVVTTIVFYTTVMVALRVAGRRTVAQMSAFDFVVTVAVGSLLANTIASRGPSYMNGAAALATLLGLQVAVAHVRQRFPQTRAMLDFSPRVVAREGRVDTMGDVLGAQLTDKEIVSKLRQRGFFDLNDVRVVVLEPDGEISVVPSDAPPETPLVPPS